MGCSGGEQGTPAYQIHLIVHWELVGAKIVGDDLSFVIICPFSDYGFWPAAPVVVGVAFAELGKFTIGLL